MRNRGIWAAVAAAAMLWPAMAAAQRASAYAAGAAAESRPLGAAQRAERHFLQQTAASLRMQWDAAQLAQARAGSPAVKELAATQLTRQKTTQPELLRLLQARGMAMPIPGNEHAKLLKELGKASGAKFDRLYVEEAVQRPAQADIPNFEKVLAQAADPVLKAWVEKQLPALHQQLARAGRALPVPAPVRGKAAL